LLCHTDPAAKMKFALVLSCAVGAQASQHVEGKCGDESKWNYNIYAPETSGSYPVMLYVTGGGGGVGGGAYSDLADRMAAKGIIVTVLSRLAAPAPEKDADLESLALTWLEKNYDTLGLTATADFDKLLLSGHSAGNHVTCSFLRDSCGNQKAKGVVMMDPVDGYDPFGFIKTYCTTPGQKLNFDVPALLVRTGLDPKVSLGVACAPDKISNQRFFDAWSGPIWMANATKYGHLDVNNAGTAKMGSMVCAADKLDNAPYQEHIAELVEAFTNTIFKADAAAESRLNDASWMKVDVELQHDMNGHSAPFNAGCTLKSVLV